MAVLPFRIPPAVDGLNEFFWTSGATGALRFMRCGACGFWIHPPLPRCPQCGDTMLAPESSEHLSESNVRHIWSCEACGHGFATCVDVFRAPRQR